MTKVAAEAAVELEWSVTKITAEVAVELVLTETDVSAEVKGEESALVSVVAFDADADAATGS